MPPTAHIHKTRAIPQQEIRTTSVWRGYNGCLIVRHILPLQTRQMAFFWLPTTQIEPRLAGRAARHRKQQNSLRLSVIFRFAFRVLRKILVDNPIIKVGLLES